MRRDTEGAEDVVTTAAAALADPDPLRRRRAIALLADQWADAAPDGPPPDPDLPRVLDGCTGETDPAAVRILTYLTRRFEDSER